MQDKGKLYLVATPIGNLEDITLRAIRILKEVDLIAAEDTRHTLQLLNHFNISKPLISYYRQNEKEKANSILDKIEEGKNIALVSDAGTPGISDPGEEIVKKAIERKIDIIPIPGACAAITALIASGMNTREFCFLGFLPANNLYKKRVLEENKYETKTIIIYEAQHKLNNTLKLIKEIWGNRKVTIARELTKVYEEYKRTDINDALEVLQDIRGEYVIIIEGSKISQEDIEIKKRNELSLTEHYKFYQNKGYSKKEIIKLIAKDRNVNKNEIYKEFT